MHTANPLRPSLRAFRALALVLVCMTMVLLTGCPGKQKLEGGPSGGYGSAGTPAPQTDTPQPAGTRPYNVMGQTYYPMLDAHGYTEEGVASWYGKDFHGKKTANGEIYDMYGMTAAHKVLPFGTQLKVTNLDNNRSITVRVNDRGPFVANRIIDLTHTGAEKLDMIGPGTARVRLESIGTIPGQKGNDLIGRFYVQIGAFSVKENAHNLAKKLQNNGQDSRVVFVPDINFHRVQAGPYPSLTAAESAATGMQGEYPNNFVLAE
ncbi:septal ring lytic transglycosylase RlpA family protein [Desulfovibrio sp. OttesenSCG-928-O18]|nr:septal ring lytic transglycosylase RlpA family protein [Desulfovibrio sp. OttesenSCG-928-O18]